MAPLEDGEAELEQEPLGQVQATLRLSGLQGECGQGLRLAPFALERWHEQISIAPGSGGALKLPNLRVSVPEACVDALYDWQESARSDEGGMAYAEIADVSSSGQARVVLQLEGIELVRLAQPGESSAGESRLEAELRVRGAQAPASSP